MNRDAEKTREEILSLIAHHVTAVNYIYRDTRFDGNAEHRNIIFEVQRIKVPNFLIILVLSLLGVWLSDAGLTNQTSLVRFPHH